MSSGFLGPEADDAYSVFRVFTPTTPARANFIPRETVAGQLVDALRTPGKQVIVFGESGTGKSTLLINLLETIYPAHITTRCTSTMTYEQLLLDAFDQLDQYVIEGKTIGKTGSFSASMIADFGRIRAAIEGARSRSEEVSEKRIIPVQLTPQRLGQFIGSGGLCWVVEDFHKVASDEKAPLAQSLKVFSDLANDYPDVKIIAVGAAETARQVVEYEPEMRRRVSEVLVPLMSDTELAAILENGQRLLNVDLASLSEQIVRFSMGVASVCHQLALNVCVTNDVLVTQETLIDFSAEDLTRAAELYVRESSDTLKATFDKALRRHKVRRYDNCRLILTALARGPLEGMLHSEVLANIREEAPDYPPGNLTLYLRQLLTEGRGSIVRASADGRYRFAEPLHHTYAQVTLLRPKPTKPRRDFEQALFEELLAATMETLQVGTSAWSGSRGAAFRKKEPRTGSARSMKPRSLPGRGRR